MSAPIIISEFGEGNPFTLDALNDNFKTLVATVNGLAGDALLQYGTTPGVFSGYMPVTGGPFAGQISAPSMLIGPPDGPKVAVATLDDLPSLATDLVAGLVTRAAAQADAVASAVAVLSDDATTAPAGGTGVAAGAWNSAANRDLAIAAINSTSALANELKADVNQLKADLNTLTTAFNALLAAQRTAGQMAP